MTSSDRPYTADYPRLPPDHPEAREVLEEFATHPPTRCGVCTAQPTVATIIDAGGGGSGLWVLVPRCDEDTYDGDWVLLTVQDGAWVLPTG